MRSKRLVNTRGGAPRGRAAPGWLYVLSNPGMPGLLKVGMTARAPRERAAELSRATNMPFPFRVEYARRVRDPAAAEAAAHALLARRRVNRGREFFRARPEEARRAVDRAARAAGGAPARGRGLASALGACALAAALAFLAFAPGGAAGSAGGWAAGVWGVVEGVWGDPLRAAAAAPPAAWAAAAAAALAALAAGAGRGGSRRARGRPGRRRG